MKRIIAKLNPVPWGWENILGRGHVPAASELGQPCVAAPATLASSVGRAPADEVAPHAAKPQIRFERGFSKTGSC